MYPNFKRYTTKVGNHSFAIETGKLAEQAEGAVTVHMNDSVVFASTTMSSNTRDGIDFLPLSVDYEERMYAGGKIPGSFFRREGRPNGDAILTSRLTDRPLRPLFPEGMRNDVQVIIYSLSSDEKDPLDILAINAASAALSISDIPWNGPIAAVRIGRINGEFIIYPTYEGIDESDLIFRLAGTKEAISMVECGANEVPEDVMVAALDLGHKSIQPLIDLQLQMAQEIGKTKREVVTNNHQKLYMKCMLVLQPLTRLLDQTLSKQDFYSGIDELKDKAIAEFAAEENGTEYSSTDVKKAFSNAEAKVIRDRILTITNELMEEQVMRFVPSTAKLDSARVPMVLPFSPEVKPKFFLSATLGSSGDSQRLDTLNPLKLKRDICTTIISLHFALVRPNHFVDKAVEKSDMVLWQKELCYQ